MPFSRTNAHGVQVQPSLCAQCPCGPQTHLTSIEKNASLCDSYVSFLHKAKVERCKRFCLNSPRALLGKYLKHELRPPHFSVVHVCTDQLLYKIMLSWLSYFTVLSTGRQFVKKAMTCKKCQRYIFPKTSFVLARFTRHLDASSLLSASLLCQKHQIFYHRLHENTQSLSASIAVQQCGVRASRLLLLVSSSLCLPSQSGRPAFIMC